MSPILSRSLLLSASLLGLATAKEGAVECGNLIYAGTKTSRCFSDEFLTTVQQKTSIVTQRRFKSVKLAEDELFKLPFVVMTGEGDFILTQKERENLKRYLENGGFLVASAGCSSKPWSTSFEREMKTIFPDTAIKDIPFDHEIFKTIFTIKELKLSKSSGNTMLKGLTLKQKIVVVYTPEGLNDSHNSEGCCCCGGNEIGNAKELNANMLAYALLH